MTTRHRSGRHFLQIPGPTNVPDRILRAMDRPTIDHRGPEFARLAAGILEDLKPIFRTSGPVVDLSVVRHRRLGGGAGQHLVAGRSGADGRDRSFREPCGATMAGRLGLEVEMLPGDWRHGVDPERIEASLADDRPHAIKAVCVVHNETSTGVTPGSPRSAAPSTGPAIRPCSWSTPSRRSPRSTTGRTNGASTSRSPARKRA